jgi:hypothetical protein
MFETISRMYRNWGIGVFALPVLVVVALVGLALTGSGRSSWMSDALRAEFTSVDYGPDAAPKQLAGETRTGPSTELKHTVSQR